MSKHLDQSRDKKRGGNQRQDGKYRICVPAYMHGVVNSRANAAVFTIFGLELTLVYTACPIFALNKFIGNQIFNAVGHETPKCSSLPYLPFHDINHNLRFFDSFIFIPEKGITIRNKDTAEEWSLIKALPWYS